MWKVTKPWSDPVTQRKGEWVAEMMTAAPASANDLGVSPEAIVAQSALETGWGQSVVGRHNLFGIKADASWAGIRVLVHTREVLGGRTVMIDDWFRDYSSFAESIADHIRFLRKNSRYTIAGVFAGAGDETYFNALQRAGYATDPNYARAMLSVRDTIRTYFLPRMSEGDTPAQPRTLMVGDHGSDVAAVQAALSIKADGYFGPQTRAAVAAFQAFHHLTADGIVGNATRSAMKL